MSKIDGFVPNIDLENKTVFLTGVSGFIGSNLAKRLFADVPSVKIIGIDNMNDYYDVRLKEARLEELSTQPNFTFVKGSIADKAIIEKIFADYKPDVVVNLAAQAGVRYSITNPDAYIESNLLGFYNILEACRHSYDAVQADKNAEYKGEEPDYCAIQNGGIMAIPDGGPLSTVGRKRGFKDMSRTTGPSYMGEIFEISSKKRYRHYFYGSTEQTLEKLYQKLNEQYPGIQIAGMYSPPFRPMTEEEDAAIIERINQTEPDFVWVGLGAPKQEKWMAAHQGAVKERLL